MWPGSKPRASKEAPAASGEGAWSDKAEKKNRKELRKLKKEIVRRKRKKDGEEEEEEEEDDLGDLEEDYRMLKKMRRGKVRDCLSIIDAVRECKRFFVAGFSV